MHKLKGSELLNTESFAKSFIYVELWVCAAACQASLEFKNFVVAKETRKRSGTQFSRIDKLVKTKQN